MNVAPIPSPLSGEHLAATWPVMRPEIDAYWRQRLNFWAGRALTAEALELDQDNRAGRVTWLGRSFTPGIVSGLEAALEAPPPAETPPTRANHFLHVLSGHGLAVTGEDVIVPQAVRVPLDQLPVYYVRITGVTEPPSEPAPVTEFRTDLDFGGFRVELLRFAAGHMPWAAILLLRPAETGSFDQIEPTDPCALDPSRDPFADQRRNDATQLILCELPLVLRQDPRLNPAQPPGAIAADDPRWRNRLAHAVFASETAGSPRHQIRFRGLEPVGQRWDTVLRAGLIQPWELLGVPLGLLASEVVRGTSQRRLFLDRASVVRPGGRSRPRSRPATRLAIADTPAALNPPGAGTPALWRARVDQLAEHLAELTETEPSELAAHFQWLPPAGLLPRSALDIIETAAALALPRAGVDTLIDRAAASRFFPRTFAVEAVPVSTQELDSVLTASAALAPFDLAAAATQLVRILVPLPERVFDPELLVVAEPDARLFHELQRLIDVRQDWLNRRLKVRERHNVLFKTVTGDSRKYPLPKDDPERQDDDELRPAQAPLNVGAVFRPPRELREVASFTFVVDELEATVIPSLGAGLPFVGFYVDGEAVPDALRIIWEGDNDARQSVWWGASGLDPNWGTAVAQSWRLGPVPEAGVWRGFLLNRREAFSIHPPVREGFEEFLANSVGAAFPAMPFRRNRYEVLRGRIAVSTGIFLFNAGTMSYSVFASEPLPGGDWEAVTDGLAEAPLEDNFQPVFPDGKPLPGRITELDNGFNRPRSERKNVATDGLVEVLQALEEEANEADDFVDLNFTRAQTNLYRIRKFVLGESAAQKLLINPALATIAEQETATASAEQLASFVSRAKGRTVTVDSIRLALEKPVNAPRSVSPAPSSTPSRVPPINVSAFEGASRPGVFFGGTVTASEVRFGETDRLAVDARTGAGAFRVDVAQPLVADIIGHLPEVGNVLPPPRPHNRPTHRGASRHRKPSYARSALNKVLQHLPNLKLRLVDERVSAPDRSLVSLLELQGFGPPRDSKTEKTLQDEAVFKMLNVKLPEKDTDEADVTFAALDFTEIKTGVLRAIERIVDVRRRLVTRGMETLGIVRTLLAEAEARLAVIDARVAETRHDVGVGRALWEEEQERIAGINTRRDELIRDEVKFLAYARPRVIPLASYESPGWQLEHADTPAPVPACLRHHDDRPDDSIDIYVRLFRHAPARWFKDLASLLAKLDTREQLVSVLESARQSLSHFTAIEAHLTKTNSAQSVQFALFSGYKSVSQSRQKAITVQPFPPQAAPWKDFLKQAEEHAAVGDLIDGRQAKAEVSTAAKAELDQIAKVATCLHAEFAAVAPIIRLAWVERYSQFDKPGSLRDLTVLPDYARLDRFTRRRLQEFVDWLFGRLGTREADAENLVNDLIRLCLLLASHAPVNRIISGHVPRPTPVRPGVVIPLRPLNPALVRVGMEFQVWHAQSIVARGRVEDLGDGEVSARVELAKTATLDPAMKVQFVAPATKMSVMKRLL